MTLQKNHGSLVNKTMDDKLIYIPNDYKQCYPPCKLKLLMEKIKRYSFDIMKVSKVFKPKNWREY